MFLPLYKTLIRPHIVKIHQPRCNTRRRVRIQEQIIRGNREHFVGENILVAAGGTTAVPEAPPSNPSLDILSGTSSTLRHNTLVSFLQQPCYWSLGQ